MQGAIRDNTPGTSFGGNVIIRNDPDGTLPSAYADSYFRKATVNNDLKMFATLDPSSDVTVIDPAAAIIENALDLQFDPVKQLALPTFTYAGG